MKKEDKTKGDVRLHYIGPRSSVSFADGRSEKLVPGTDVTLPDGSYTQSLIERGYAKPITIAPPAPTPSPVTVSPVTKSAKESKEKS